MATPLELISRQAEQTVNIDPWSGNSDAETPLFTDETVKAYPISPEGADRLAFMGHYGLANILKKSKEEIYKDLTFGGEASTREQAAAELDARKGNAVQKALREVAKNRPDGKLTNEDFNFFEKAIGELNEKTDPDLVFEQAYAKEYMNALERAGVRLGSDLSQAGQDIPSLHAKNLDLGSDLGTKTGWLDTLEERVQQQYDAQSWPGFLADQGKMLAPGYPILKLTGRAPNTGVSLFVGENMEQQGIEYYKLPLKEFKEKTAKDIEALSRDNPYAALTYIRALKGMSTNEVVLNTLFPLVDIATLPVGYLGGKAVKAAKSLTTSKGAINTYLKELNQTAPSPSSIASAAGDLREAAVIRSTAEAVQNMLPRMRAAAGAMEDIPASPTRDMINQLPTTLINDNVEMAASPGRFGQENVNRFIERTGQLTDKLFRGLVETLGVNRLGEVISTETSVRAIMDHIKDSYGGLKNRVLDIKKPEFEPLTKTWFMRMVIGDGGAAYFPTRKQAELFAERNGLADAKVYSQENVLNAHGRNLSPVEVNQMAKRLEKGGDVVGFETAKGSKYVLKQKGRSTVRDKAARPDPGHEGDSGIKKQSSRTIYITPEDARRIAPGQGGGWNMVVSGGKVHLVTKTPDGKGWGIPGGKDNIATFSTTPEVGKIPLELWNPVLVQGRPAFREVHFGNNITKLVHAGEEAATTPKIASVKQQGAGWYIEKIIPIDETMPVVRDAIRKEVETVNSKAYSPRSFLGDWFGKIRTPEENLSLAQRENRKIVTYAPSVFREIIQESLNEIKELKGYWPKSKWKDWQRIIKEGESLLDNQGKPGKFFDSPHELEEFYNRLLGRLPDEQEVRAYFAFKRTMEYDRMFRNIAVHRNMLRVGAEEHTFFTLSDGARLSSPKFAGVAQAEFPGGEGSILIVGDKLGDESVHALSPALKKKWEEKVASGEYKVVEVYDPEKREFKGFGSKVGNARVRYVMAKNVETKALDVNHIPRRGGGHIEYEYDHYIKQAKLRWDEVQKKWFYEGDQTLMAVPLPKLGKEVLVHLNKVRELLKAAEQVGKTGDDAARLAGENAARDYAQQHMDIDYDTLRGWFKAQKNDEGVVVPPRLSLEEPLFVVSKDKNILQMDNTLLERIGADQNNFRDGTKSGSLARQFSVQFTEERDAEKLLAVGTDGTKYSPIYKMTHAETIDPISTMNRALNRIVTTNFFDDYKIFSVEHWLQEAAPHLEVNKSVLMHSPFWHFNNALTMFKVGADKDAIARLKTQHMQIQQLLGVPSETDSFIESAAQKLADAIYSATGKTYVLDPKRDLPFLTDPVRFIRGAVFHTNIGLFNIPQFIVQSMNYVNMAALAPRHALNGSFAAQLHFWSRVNSHPNIMKHLDDAATKLRVPGLSRYKPGEFTEAVEEMQRTGFGNVGREYAVLDDIMREKFITSGGRSFLDAGTIFFKGGERNARYGAWHTAFKEWRDANPFKKIDNADRAAILDRADMLNMNMSRASNSMIHQGIWSIPTQFLTYQLRVAELFFGKRLGKTTSERMLARARLVVFNAFAFGIPTAAGVTAMPFTDAIRTYALENGYIVGEDFLSSMAMEGVPAAITALITGGGDPSKGTWYNFGDRYGTKGFENINNLMRADKTFWDIFGGAAYSKLSSTWAQSDGLRAAMMSIIRDDEQYFPLKIEDFMDVFKEISSVNAGWRTIMALNTGQWMSKHEGYISDVSPANAIFGALTGAQEQNISDVYRLSQSLSKQKDLEKYVEKQFIQEFRRFLNNADNKNQAEADRNLTRARVFLKIGGYPKDKYKSLIRMAVQNNKSLVDRIDLQFYLKNAPDAKKEMLKEAFRTKVNMRDNSESNN